MYQTKNKRYQRLQVAEDVALRHCRQSSKTPWLACMSRTKGFTVSTINIAQTVITRKHNLCIGWSTVTCELSLFACLFRCKVGSRDISLTAIWYVSLWSRCIKDPIILSNDSFRKPKNITRTMAQQQKWPQQRPETRCHHHHLSPYHWTKLESNTLT